MSVDYYVWPDRCWHCAGCDREAGCGHNTDCPIAAVTGELTAEPGEPIRP